MINLKFKKLQTNAVVPSKGHTDDVGLDLTATSLKVVDEGKYGYYEYGTGLAVDIPKGHTGLIFPRSSISDKGLILANSVGIIDPGFQGEIRCRFKYIRESAKYELGDRVAQLVILPVPEVSLEEVQDFEPSQRGEGGFGSTNLQE